MDSVETTGETGEGEVDLSVLLVFYHCLNSPTDNTFRNHASPQHFPINQLLGLALVHLKLPSTAVYPVHVPQHLPNTPALPVLDPSGALRTLAALPLQTLARPLGLGGTAQEVTDGEAFGVEEDQVSYCRCLPLTRC